MSDHKAIRIADMCMSLQEYQKHVLTSSAAREVVSACCEVFLICTLPTPQLYDVSHTCAGGSKECLMLWIKYM